MQNLTLRGGDGTAEHPAVGRIGWRRHWPNTAGRWAALPFPRPPTNHQTHYKRYSAQKTPIFLFNSGPAVGRGAAGAYWHLISDCQVTTRVRLPAPQFPATLSFWSSASGAVLNCSQLRFVVRCRPPLPSSLAPTCSLLGTATGHCVDW